VLCVISVIVAINSLVESRESTLLLPRAENKTRDTILLRVFQQLLLIVSRLRGIFFLPVVGSTPKSVQGSTNACILFTPFPLLLRSSVPSLIRGEFELLLLAETLLGLLACLLARPPADYPPTDRPTYLRTYVPTCVSACLTAWPPTHLPTYLSTNLYVSRRKWWE
jgi:hypothetical protein